MAAHTTAVVAAKKAPRGVPFQKGTDPRRNLGGRRPSRATQALHEAIKDNDLVAMWRSGMAAAQGGDAKWAALIAAYLDGKPVGREENGQPGDFDLDLSDIDSEKLRAAFKRVK